MAKTSVTGMVILLWISDVFMFIVRMITIVCITIVDNELFTGLLSRDTGPGHKPHSETCMHQQ